MGQCPPPVAPKSPSQRGGHAAEDAARRDPLAHAQGVNQASVAQIEDAHRWHPHQIETFKRSTATRCVETLTDVVGVDEQPQGHALDRTHPGVPRKKGRCGPLTHDDKPHGTTSLFAARTVLDGTVIGPCDPRHRHEEWLKFLPVIDRDTSPGQALHVILDNDGRPTTPRSRSGWRDLHAFICTLRRRVPRG